MVSFDNPLLKIYAYICLAVQKSKQQMIFKKLDLVNFDQISAISKFITPLPIDTKIARA